MKTQKEERSPDRPLRDQITISSAGGPFARSLRLHSLSAILCALLAALALLAPAALHANIWDKVRKTSDGIKKGKEAVQKADRVSTKTKRVVKGIKGFPLEQEIALGDSVALEITGRHGGIWPDEDATRRVNLVGKALARYCDRQELAWIFGILDSDAVNAFSAPGGRVFITRGAYELARDDDELAGILGHEIAHIVRRHALSSLRRGEILAAGLDLADEINGASTEYGSDVDTILGTLFENGFEPAAEYEADSASVSLCEIAGFDRGGLRSVLEAISERPRTGEWNPSGIFSKHPPLVTRIAKLPKRATASRLPASSKPAHEHEAPPGAKFCPVCGQPLQ